MKIVSWLIALCGLWEFGDIAALLVPGFGNIPTFIWNHIVVGLVLLITGVWSALTRSVAAAKILACIAAVAAGWLLTAAFVLGGSVMAAGQWNDIVVGVVALSLGISGAVSASRARHP